MKRQRGPSKTASPVTGKLCQRGEARPCFREAEKPQRVAGWRGVEDDVTVAGYITCQQSGELVEGGDLRRASPRNYSRTVDCSAAFASFICSSTRARVRLCCGIRIDVHG
jgi:hypothetical protein